MRDARDPSERLYSGVLLAAGEGRRFGGPKALAELRGELLVERGVRLLIEGGCAEVVVVLGAGADEVRRRVALGQKLGQGLGQELRQELGQVRTVVNHQWPTGMGSSLAAGLRALALGTGAAVVALVDQPLVGPAAVRRLARAWREGAMAAVATYGGQLRNPVLFDQSLWPEVVASATGDKGAREFLRSRADLVTPVACDDTGAPDDVDTRADLLAIAKEREPCS
jgi:CTP:molybdopterin cytidylyltransferase MocA